MADHENYQVAIDILRCHLGMSLDEAKKSWGLMQSVKRKSCQMQKKPLSD